MCCAADEGGPALFAVDNAVPLLGVLGSASGVYLGEGVVLTDWHVRTREREEVQLGQEVVVAGFPLGRGRTLAESCHVIATPTLVRDPDLVNPSDSQVPSFAIDCKSTQHGSSGSPVFDASSGALLGLLWTGPCEELGKCKPPAFISAASAWLQQGERAPAEYSQLRAVLDRFPN